MVNMNKEITKLANEQAPDCSWPPVFWERSWKKEEIVPWIIANACTSDLSRTNGLWGAQKFFPMHIPVLSKKVKQRGCQVRLVTCNKSCKVGFKIKIYAVTNFSKNFHQNCSDAISKYFRKFPPKFNSDFIKKGKSVSSI